MQDAATSRNAAGDGDRCSEASLSPRVAVAPPSAHAGAADVMQPAGHQFEGMIRTSVGPGWLDPPSPPASQNHSTDFRTRQRPSGNFDACMEGGFLDMGAPAGPLQPTQYQHAAVPAAAVINHVRPGSTSTMAGHHKGSAGNSHELGMRQQHQQQGSVPKDAGSHGSGRERGMGWGSCYGQPQPQGHLQGPLPRPWSAYPKMAAPSSPPGSTSPGASSGPRQMEMSYSARPGAQPPVESTSQPTADPSTSRIQSPVTYSTNEFADLSSGGVAPRVSNTQQPRPATPQGLGAGLGGLHMRWARSPSGRTGGLDITFDAAGDAMHGYGHSGERSADGQPTVEQEELHLAMPELQERSCLPPPPVSPTHSGHYPKCSHPDHHSLRSPTSFVSQSRKAASPRATAGIVAPPVRALFPATTQGQVTPSAAGDVRPPLPLSNHKKGQARDSGPASSPPGSLSPGRFEVPYGGLANAAEQAKGSRDQGWDPLGQKLRAQAGDVSNATMDPAPARDAEQRGGASWRIAAGQSAQEAPDEAGSQRQAARPGFKWSSTGELGSLSTGQPKRSTSGHVGNPLFDSRTGSGVEGLV